MKLLLDTNVVVDALIERGDSHEVARLLIALGKIGEFDLWVSPTQWTDLFYLLSEGGKRSRAAIVTAVLKELRQSVHIAMMGEQEIDCAMALGWSDVEDAVVYEVARSMNADALVTANKKDYAKAKIPVYTVSEFFAWLQEERGVIYAEIAWG